MISRDSARSLLADRLGNDVVILDERTIEKDWGWVFFYQSRRFVEANRFEDMLVGNGPYLVNRFDGSVHGTDTHHPIECYIQRYERQLKGEGPRFGQNPRAWLDHVSLDTSRYVFKGDTNRGDDDWKRSWETRDGDSVELLFTALPPMLTPDAQSVSQVEQCCRKRCEGFGRILDFRLLTLDEMDCIWMILQFQADFILGSLIIPFADFSFEVGICCSEHGTQDTPQAAVEHCPTR